MQQRTGKVQPRFHAFGIVAHPFIRIVLQPHRRQQRARGAGRFAVQRRKKAQIFGGGQLFVKGRKFKVDADLLIKIRIVPPALLPGKLHRPAIARQQPHQNFLQCGFARARRPQKAENFPLCDRKIHVLDQVLFWGIPKR
ncbi:hypothetical protein SDC9_128336 [bioreactor metagenome]|uniref:Uncharacterized protein n=1 Tax=bioreactor metagenome TaxID=1076179 RepID=A0A645CWI6_9ZZZZ